MRHKILYIISTLESGGPVNVLYNIVKYLDNKKWDIRILTLSAETDNSRIQEFRNLGIQIDSLNLSRLRGFISGKKSLMRYLDQGGFSLLHSNALRADLLCARLCIELPVLTTIHINLSVDFKMTYGKLLGQYISRQHLKALNKIQHKVACSKTLSKNLQEQGLHVSFIQNGVDTEFFHPVDLSRSSSLKRSLGIPAGKNIIVMTGHLNERKDPLTAMMGFVNSEFDKDNIMIVLGDGELRRECEIIARERGNIQIKGNVSNVAEYLQVADIFISSSQSEGLPNSVLEALACGVTVCISDIEQHREILDFNPGAGFLFLVKDYAHLSRCIDMVIHKGVSPDNDQALDIIRNHLNARRMSSLYQIKYGELIMDLKEMKGKDK